MVSIAVVGCGYWGPNIIRNFSSLENCALHSVCDLDLKRLTNIQRQYPSVQAVTDVSAIFNNPAIDAVAICTPLHSHYPLASAALKAGKHVLLTKPLADSVAAAQHLVELAEARNLILQVDDTFIYSGAVQKLRTILDSGEIGDLLYFDSTRINLGLFQSDTNVLWDLAPHDVSILHYLIDQTPLWVSAIGVAHYGQREDLAYVTIGFPNALIAHLHLSWLAPVKLRSTLIGGSKRMIVYDDLAPSEKIRIYDKSVTLHSDQVTRSQALVDYRIGDMFAPHIDHTEPLHNVCTAFVSAIESGSSPLTNGRTGLQVVRVLEAAQQSICSNGERLALADFQHDV